MLLYFYWNGALGVSINGVPFNGRLLLLSLVLLCFYCKVTVSVSIAVVLIL